MGRKILDYYNKKQRINITLPGFVIVWIDKNRGNVPRATYITHILLEVIKQKEQ